MLLARFQAINGTADLVSRVGVVLCAMAIAATLIRPPPLSTSMLYLPIGWALGPHGLNAIQLHLVNDAPALEEITKVIILISLFSNRHHSGSFIDPGDCCSQEHY